MRLQTGQEGRYSLVATAPDRTSVTYELTIHHNLPLPGFIRGRVIRGLMTVIIESTPGWTAYLTPQGSIGALRASSEADESVTTAARTGFPLSPATKTNDAAPSPVGCW